MQDTKYLEVNDESMLTNILFCSISILIKPGYNNILSSHIVNFKYFSCIFNIN